MGLLGERPSQDDDGGGLAGRGLTVDLDERHCARCGRLLHPWEEACPDDGGAAVRAGEAPPPSDALLARLLARDDEPGAGSSAPATEPTVAEDQQHDA